MFCPNCGTQNSETASTCTKCGFNLKGAAAPKFKGTMLMNQSPPGAAPGAPAAAPPPAAPRPGMPAPAPLNPNLAGTVVGVSPAGMGASPIAAPPPAPPPPPGYGAPPAQSGYPAAAAATAPLGPQGYGAPPPQQGGFSPAGPPQGGVNPLGGTMAIDQMPNFAAGGYAPPAGPPPSPYGAPPPQQAGAFGAPGMGGGQPGFPPPQGAPPGGGFGAPADPYGAPPPQQNPYGAPPQQTPYGAPPQGPGYGGPTGQEMMQAGQQFGAAAGNAIQAGFNAQPGGKPTMRNPVVTLLIAYAVLGVAPSVLGTILGIIGLGALAGLAGLACFIVYGFLCKPMILEAQTAANNQDIKWWWQLVPGLHIYFDALKVPELITAAKTQRGLIQQKPTRSLVFYLFLFPYALALDLNDLA